MTHCIYYYYFVIFKLFLLIISIFVITPQKIHQYIFAMFLYADIVFVYSQAIIYIYIYIYIYNIKNNN